MTKLRRKPRSLVVLGTSLVLLAGMAWSKDKDKDASDVEKRLDASARVLTEIMGTPDKAIPDKVMGDAKCLAVIPSMVKIAIGFGGNHGKGVATCRTSKGWSAPVPITITGGSWGLQLGGQAVDLVMVIMPSGPSPTNSSTEKSAPERAENCAWCSPEARRSPKTSPNSSGP